MGYARKNLVCLEDTPYYHVISRCVRRAWLWGFDEYSGKDYSHRKTWVLERLKYLSQSFAIDVCAFAVMSNHYHLVLHVDRERAISWTLEEVVQRWARLFRISTLVDQWQQGLGSEAQRREAEAQIETWRQRLYDLSEYMARLNEYLAHRANAEDQCKGRFWEGRFKSQALLDEAALVTAMAYVDLNPVRAGIAATPEASTFTSISQRITQLAFELAPSHLRADPEVPLYDFQDRTGLSTAAIPFHFSDYLQLLDWSGRSIRSDKRGAIDPAAPLILERLKIDVDAWAAAMQPKGNAFGRAVGRVDRLRLHARTLGQSWIKGLRQAKRLYGTGWPLPSF
jgi:REP element-mobilizing transposase RayT